MLMYMYMCTHTHTHTLSEQTINFLPLKFLDNFPDGQFLVAIPYVIENNTNYVFE